jgi:hypothetical protein
MEEEEENDPATHRIQHISPEKYERPEDIQSSDQNEYVCSSHKMTHRSIDKIDPKLYE